MNMLAKKAKKGFTIVELVIVIAVIAILAAVLIPTFTSVIENANESAAMQESKNEWTNYLAEIAGEGNYTKYTYYVENGDYVFEVANGEFNTEALEEADIPSYLGIDVSTITKNDGKYYEYTTTDGVKIYNKTLGDAAAAAAAETAIGNTAGTYYASVTDSDSNVCYFKLVYENSAWTEETITSSAYATVKADTTSYKQVPISTQPTGYTVEAYTTAS